MSGAQDETIPAGERRVLRRHHLRHLGELRLHENLFAGRFAPDCSMTRCSGSCCKFGVYADVAERDRILAHADRITPHMDPHQEKNPAAWFEESEYDDGDFPSGRCIGTRAMPYGCVFLNAAGRCTLQIAAVAEGMDKFFLKPFYCVAYPIVIEDGVLMVDDEDFLNRPECCRMAAGGTQNILDLCDEELRFVVGDAATKELRTLMQDKKEG